MRSYARLISFAIGLSGLFYPTGRNFYDSAALLDSNGENVNDSIAEASDLTSVEAIAAFQAASTLLVQVTAAALSPR